MSGNGKRSLTPIASRDFSRFLWRGASFRKRRQAGEIALSLQSICFWGRKPVRGALASFAPREARGRTGCPKDRPHARLPGEPSRKVERGAARPFARRTGACELRRTGRLPRSDGRAASSAASRSPDADPRRGRKQKNIMHQMAPKSSHELGGTHGIAKFKEEDSVKSSRNLRRARLCLRLSWLTSAAADRAFGADVVTPSDADKEKVMSEAPRRTSVLRRLLVFAPDHRRPARELAAAQAAVAVLSQRSVSRQFLAGRAARRG